MEINKMNLYEAIIEIQSDTTLFTKKSGKNTTYKSASNPDGSYFTEQDIYRVLKPELAKRGIGYVIGSVGKPEIQYFKELKLKKGEGNYELTTYIMTCEGEITLFDTLGNKLKTGVPLVGQNTGGADKSVGVAYTYDTRYALCKIFGIPTDELDPDNRLNPTENTQAIAKAQVKASIGLDKTEYQKNYDLKYKLINDIKLKLTKDKEYQQRIKSLIKDENGNIPTLTSLSIEKLKELWEC